MNLFSKRNTLFTILVLACLVALGGCSPKSSNEDIAEKVKAAMEAEKAKEQAAIAESREIASQVRAVMAEEKAKEQATRSSSKPRPAAPKSAQASQTAPDRSAATCSNCGTVVSVKVIEVEGKGSGLGVVAGGVAGGLLGNQVGGGSGRDVATVVGVVGGAVAGNKIEKTMKKVHVYDVTVRMNSGVERVLRHAADPGVASGDKIAVTNDQVTKQ